MNPWRFARRRMIARQLLGRDVRDRAVLRAMSRVPRHRFVPGLAAAAAYADRALPIGHGQTISQPYIVARMLELLELREGQRVLDVGTGSGYQAAVLAEMGMEVLGVEIVPALREQASRVLADCGYSGVRLVLGDGGLGWPEEAPFEAIVAAAAPAELPEALGEQLVDGGRLVLPLGRGRQHLWKFVRRGSELHREQDCAVAFVPMTGLVEERVDRPGPGRL